MINNKKTFINKYRIDKFLSMLSENINYDEYRKNLEEKLKSIILKQKNLELERFFEDTFYFFSYSVDSLLKNVDEDQKQILTWISSAIIQIHDILRSTKINQELLLLTSSVSNYRISIEIEFQLKYIFKNEKSQELAERFYLFGMYEQLRHHNKKLKENPNYKCPNTFKSDETAKILYKKCPDWFDNSKIIKLKNIKNFLNKPIEKIARFIGEDEYKEYLTYKSLSKIIHASSISQNIYKDNLVNSSENITMFNKNTVYHCLSIIKIIYSQFSSKNFDEERYCNLISRIIKV